MGKRGRKKRARKKSAANHGKRPNARAACQTKARSVIDGHTDRVRPGFFVS